MSEKLGTEKIEKVVDAIGELAKVAKKISEDKKVDVQDLAHVIALAPKLPELLAALKDIGEALDEGKDIDVAEVIVLIQKIHAKVKEIEAA